jgi:DNA polymerase III subunit alpha
MFATLDDLEGSVELVIFGKVLAEYEALLHVDSVLLVRGRIDHKDAAKTNLVVQAVDRFAPTAAEVDAAKNEMAKRHVGPEPLHLVLDGTRLPATIIDDLRDVLNNFPGTSDVIIEIQIDAEQSRRLRLGKEYRVAPTPTLRAELDALLRTAGERTVVAVA